MDAPEYWAVNTTHALSGWREEFEGIDKIINNYYHGYENQDAYI